METIFPYLHIVSDENVLHVKHLYKYKNLKQFEHDIAKLCKIYKPVNLPDYLTMKKNGDQNFGKSFLLTFDDGFREIYEVVAPLLLKFGVPATFFIVTNFLDNMDLYYGHKKSLLIEHCIFDSNFNQKVLLVLKNNNFFNGSVRNSLKVINYKNKYILDKIANETDYDFDEYLRVNKPYLTSFQVDDLIKKGFAIGGHSLDHPKYSLITIEEQIRQTLGSVKILRDKFLLDYGAFAFPHSDSGVTKKYFDHIFSSGIVDITFGTGGMIRDSVSFNIQRFSAEKPSWPIKTILAKEQLRKLYRMLRGKMIIPRNY
jgi:peptidoglycan/xylan/chitin deacetylase (PgdA/CDA1 family)